MSHRPARPGARRPAYHPGPPPTAGRRTPPPRRRRFRCRRAGPAGGDPVTAVCTRPCGTRPCAVCTATAPSAGGVRRWMQAPGRACSIRSTERVRRSSGATPSLRRAVTMRFRVEGRVRQVARVPVAVGGPAGRDHQLPLHRGPLPVGLRRVARSPRRPLSVPDSPAPHRSSPRRLPGRSVREGRRARIPPNGGCGGHLFEGTGPSGLRSAVVGCRRRRGGPPRGRAVLRHRPARQGDSTCRVFGRVRASPW